MIRKRAMVEKHIQIAKACVKKAKKQKRSNRIKLWIHLAEKQIEKAEQYIKFIN